MICLAGIETADRINYFVRLETGEVEWNGRGDGIPEIVVCYVAEDFDKSLFTVLSEESTPNLLHLIFDPSLSRWSGKQRLGQFLARQDRAVSPKIVSTATRGEFEQRMRRLIGALHLDCEYRLLEKLGPEIGSINLASWKRQFSDAGRDTFPRMILPCLRNLAPSEIAKRLRFDDIAGMSHFAILNVQGSDLIILRGWQAKHGYDFECRQLSEVVKATGGGETILLFVDAIHSGEQLIGALNGLEADLTRKRLSVIVRPVFVTKFGVSRVLSRFREFGGLNLDTSTCVVLENVGSTGLKVSELEMRLREFEVAPSAIGEVVRFCRIVGAGLIAVENDAQLDLTLGLGGFGLGLTTILASRPSKGALPVIRLGGEIAVPESEKRINWIPLIPHRNMSGVG